MAAGAILTMPLIGRLIERVGGRPVIPLAGAARLLDPPARAAAQTGST